MNFYYIDYMIKEQQREELEACERHRLLKSAAYTQTGPIHRAGSFFSNIVQRLKELRVVPPKRPIIWFSTRHDGVRIKGDSDVA